MKLKKTLVFFVITILSVLLVNSLSAQSGRGKGRINGRVLDESGKAIPNAKILLLYEDKIIKIETTSDKSGKWAALGLGTGKYRIKASAKGYIPTQTLVFVRQLSRNEPVIFKLKQADRPVASEELMKFLDQGNKYFDEKKYDEAIPSFQKLLDEHPELYKVKYKIADCYREKKDFDKALQIYEEVIVTAKEKKDINTAAEAMGTIGGMYLNKKDLKKAQLYFQQSIEMNPKNEILAYNVGEINFDSNNVDNAIKYFKIAATIKPTWSVPFMKLAYCYLNKGDNANAIINLKKVIELEPNSENGKIAQDIIKSLSN